MRLAGAQIVLDTNILVHILRGRVHGQLIDNAYALTARKPRPIIPVVVKGEIKSFAMQSNWGSDKRGRLDQLVNSVPTADISSSAVVTAYSEIDSYSRGIGRDMGKNDAWIAAIAAVMGATVLTTDKDFEHLNGKKIAVEFIDPENLKLGNI